MRRLFFTVTTVLLIAAQRGTATVNEVNGPGREK